MKSKEIEKDIIEYIEKFESEKGFEPSMYRIVKDTKYARTTVKKYYDKYYKNQPTSLYLKRKGYNKQTIKKMLLNISI